MAYAGIETYIDATWRGQPRARIEEKRLQIAPPALAHAASVRARSARQARRDDAVGLQPEAEPLAVL